METMFQILQYRAASYVFYKYTKVESKKIKLV